MKKIILFVAILFNSSIFSQTLLETVDLPNGTFWDYAYGMVYNNSKYWISSYSSSGVADGVLYAVDSTGTQVDQLIINYPTIKPSQGLTHDGINFWYIERYGGGDFFKVAPDGTVLDSIISTQLFGGSWYIGGAGWDGTNLWVSVYYPNTDVALYKIDVNAKSIVDTISTYGTQPQGITFKNDTLFYVMDDNDGDDERVFAVDLVTEDTLFSFHVPDQSSQSPRGLAWDGTYFWLLAEPVGGGINERQLFKYDLGGSGAPSINVPITNVYFPNTTVGTTSNYNLAIYSIGAGTLTIDSINATGNGFSFDPISFPLQIPPGNSSDVVVNFTPTSYAFYNGTVTIYCNDPINPSVEVLLKGQGLVNGATIGLSASSHNFGSVWVGEGITYWDFNIFNMGDQPLDVSAMEFSLPEFSIETPSIPFQILSADTVDLKIYFYPAQVATYEDTLKINTNDLTTPIAKISVIGTGIFNQYNYGFTFWQYQVPSNVSNTSYKVEGLKPINDITGDGIPDVVISTENYWTMCLDGAASGTSFPIWTFSTYMGSDNTGSIGQSWDYGVQDAIQIANDLNGDGFNDVVLAIGGGNEHVYALDGTNGEIIWEYGDNINYSLGDFEAVDVQRDFNGDNIEDVLAIADGNSSGTGYRRAFLFNGTNGSVIWEHFYPGPATSVFGKTIISIDDFTGDNIPEAVIAYGNNGSTNESARALDGSNGQTIWTRDMVDDKPKELLALPLPADSTDIIAAEYNNYIHRLNGRNGQIVWTYPLGGSPAVIQIGLIEDLNSDLIPDVLIASFAANGLNCLSGLDGTQLWAHPMDLQYGVAAVPDIDFDGAEDVITGDQTGTYYCISGKGDSLIFSHNFSNDRISTVNVIPSIDGNYSFELLSGTKEGKVACFSGGYDNVLEVKEITEELPTVFKLLQNYPNPFNPSTKIDFQIPIAGLVSLKVFDILGREVTTLLNEELQPGNYTLDFDAITLASGIYFYTLNAGEFVSTKKMILLK